MFGLSMQYLIHIGYPKAASSLLQSTLFSGQDPFIKPLNIQGKPFVGYQKSGGRLFFNRRSHGVDSYLDPFEYSFEKVREAITSATDNDAKVTCLSNELWAGHPFSGGITAKEYADRFYKTLPEAKILIIPRNQVDMIFSAYVHYVVRVQGGCTLEGFLLNNKHSQIPFHNLSYYNYDKLTEYYIGLFGKDNVLVHPFEVLTKHGEKDFFKQIYDFLGVEAKVDFSEVEKNTTNYSKYILLRRFLFLNSFTVGGPISTYRMPRLLAIKEPFLKLLSPFVRKSSIKKAISSDKELIRNCLGDDMKQSNLNLQRYVSHDLKTLGYDLG